MAGQEGLGSSLVGLEFTVLKHTSSLSFLPHFPQEGLGRGAAWRSMWQKGERVACQQV